MKIYRVIISNAEIHNLFYIYLPTLNIPFITNTTIKTFPDIVLIGVYLLFLERAYNIIVFADNNSYALYYGAVPETSIHYSASVKYFNQNKDLKIKVHTGNTRTITDNLIDGIIAALNHIITPF